MLVRLDSFQLCSDLGFTEHPLCSCFLSIFVVLENQLEFNMSSLTGLASIGPPAAPPLLQPGNVIAASVAVISMSRSNQDEVMLGQTTATVKLQKHQWMFTRVNIPNQNLTSMTG